MKYILGIQTGHDAAAALIVDGKIVADAAEERFTRVKNDSSFPLNAIAFCLKYAEIKSEELDAIALPHNYLHPSMHLFFDIPRNRLPTIKSRLKKTFLQYAPISKKTNTVLPLYQRPLKLSPKCKIILVGHHKSHAGSAYYTSGLYDERALVVTMDGIGDSSSITIWKGQANKLEHLKSWGGEASLGWFYSNCTEALGWRHGSDEWKTMGLAPYGKTSPGALDGFHPDIKRILAFGR